MSILDDAIREHLELKRAHGADESELKRLEDEAFGPPGRPQEADPFAEAPTEFMATEESAEGVGDEGSRRRINVADLQEPPPPEPAGRAQLDQPDAPPEPEEPFVEPEAAAEAEAEAPMAPAEDAAQAAPPAEESPVSQEPALAEQPPVSEEPATSEESPVAEEPPVADATEAAQADERQAIAEQPTELFDIEAQMAGEAPATEAPGPSDEQLLEAELEEPKLAPAEPPTEIHASRTEPAPAPLEEDEEDEEFWGEQRLSDELDKALEAPITDEHEAPSPTEEHEAPRPAPDPAAVYEDADGEDGHDEGGDQPRVDYDPDTGHEDVLEDTPQFLEESPEDDELWFEQKPPKDFDFDD